MVIQLRGTTFSGGNFVWPCYGEMLTWDKQSCPVNEDFTCHLSYLLVWVEIWNSHYIIVLKSCTSPAGTWIWLSSWQPISKQRTTCYEMVHLRLFSLSLRKNVMSLYMLFFLIITAWFDRPRPFHFAIVDEVDSVLIDEGRNPLLISGEV